MKRVSSVVWQFFDRLEENKRCVAVLCKLCDTEYKYFGNTTNLRAHLIKKHPIQWEFRQNNLDGQKSMEESLRSFEDDNTNITDAAGAPKRLKYTISVPKKNVEGAENSETEIDPIDLENETATLNLVRQMHDNQGSDEEWLEEDYVQLDMYEPTLKRKIKREVVSPARQSRFKYIPRRGKTSPKVEQVNSDETKKDEYTVFGEYIANKLRKFKLPRTRGNVQQIITTILWQAEYGLYDDADSVKRVLLSSMQCGDVEHTNNLENEVQIPTEPYVEESNQSNEGETSMA